MRQTRYITKRSFVLLIIALTGICALVFNLIYEKAKESAINRLNDEQLIHAKQAARGIEEYFSTWTGILTSLSKMDEIETVDAVGKRQMQLFYDAHQDQIRSFTRMDEQGTILFTVPDNESIGRSLTHQKHVQELLKTRKPVISDVFRTVQGYDAVALHVPVFKGAQFKGSIAIIINFQSLAKRYLEIIKIGKTGYAWVVSRDGTELYCPVPGHTGNSVLSNCKEFPSIIAMAHNMLKGQSGNTTYTFNMISNTKIAPVTKHAVYYPINLGNTFWSIVVASSSEEILFSLSSYRNRLILVMVLALIGGIIIAGLGVKALLIVKEENVRAHAEEELRANEQRYRHLFERNPAMMLICERGNLQVLAVNEAFLLNYGYSNEEALALRFTDLYPVEEQARVIEAATKISGYCSSGEWHHCRKDGTRLTIVATSNDISYQGRKARITVITDITERKRLEEQLHQAQKIESIGRLAGGVAHDFNNMLGVIMGHAELGRLHIDPGHRVYSDLMAISKTAERSAELTRQLLAFARKQTIAPKVLNLNEVVTGMLKMLQRLIGEDISLAWHPGANLWPVKIDSSQLDQILANLCVNARDALDDVGRITIETCNSVIAESFCAEETDMVPGEYVCLSVRDTGHGMDKQTLANIFEPFFTTKELGKGTGLGLATVYGAVKQNNGYIYVNSEAGAGTTFSIYLPRCEGKHMHAPVEGEAGASPKGSETILLVEDEPGILNMATMILAQLGYNVLAVKNPCAALQLTREHEGDIDLLMTDVVMPEMNGLDLAKDLLSLYPNIKCLFMSGYTADVIAHHGVLDDGVHFIQKPFKMNVLAGKLREVLDS
jgi:PAS domain S-box-containing protein